MPSSSTIQTVGGVTRGALPWWVLTQGVKTKTLILVSKEEDVLSLVDDMRGLFKLPQDWGSFRDFGVEGYAVDSSAERPAAHLKWQFGKSHVLVASKEGLTIPCDPVDDLRNRAYLFRPGTTIRRGPFEEKLATGGYVRNEWTEQVGEYSIRGDVIDIWPALHSKPIRITWNVDTVEAIRPVDMASNRSEGFLPELMLYPVQPGTGSTLLEKLPDDVHLFSFESSLEENNVPAGFSGPPLIKINPQPLDDSDQGYIPTSTFSGHIDQLRKQLMEWHQDDWRVVVFCHNRGERDRLDELLEDPFSTDRGRVLPWMPKMLIGEVEHGFINPTQRLAIITNSEIFGRYRKRIRLPKFEGGAKLGSHMDIKPLDFLVHEKHGIGRYIGLTTLKVGDITSEFMTLEYKGGDRLYVPIFELQQVQKYLGAEGKRPPLSSLDKSSWERVKSKVKEDVAKLAADLLKKAAKRSIRPGFSHPPRSHLETEFAHSFMYELTPDQKKSLIELEEDMQQPQAMDRLVCGDVGFGKTEVAMRAALKSALNGKQVAFLCPTTILAEQHARNFIERMADYPIVIKLLSRFQTKKEQKDVLKGVAEGSVDIVIGTHRLLSKDVVFKDLRLVIIDEEHRFGVKQKNKFLAIRETADVLSLTATPIPRTLASAMGGIKNLSLIETPPPGRLPIHTHVGAFDEDIMAKAIQSELDREGQVFYVHNRIKTLLARKTWLESLLPQIRIGMAHGRMKETELEKVMYDFLHRKLDVLLCTTIIESGLDIPSVNTLVVEEAEEMGLAQLYQLRGRVWGVLHYGRTVIYLILMAGMTSAARKRLEALKEYTALGSGFRLAMRDMEIRGAGNLLGNQQHGNMAAVGVETYSRLLTEEIAKLKGEPSDEEAQRGPLLEISISAYIPEDYMPSESERVFMYKRVLSTPQEQLVNLKEELVDRCGPLPDPTKALFDAAFLRWKAGQNGISEVHQAADHLLIYFRTKFEMPEAAFQRLLDRNGQGLSLIQGPPMGVHFNFKPQEKSLDGLGRFIREIFNR